MNSIPHYSHAGNMGQDQSPKSTIPRAEKPQDQIRGFHYSALHAVTGYNYLTRKWLPILGLQAYGLIQVLRTFCYYDPLSGETRDSCFPELATLAKMLGIGRSTLCRLLKRDAEGCFIRYDRKTKTWVRWELNTFLRIDHRRRYSVEHEREVQTSNLYLVALDDPPTPEDEEKVREKERELMALLAERQAEQQRTQGTAQHSAGACSESQNETHRAAPDCDSQSRAKMAQQKSRPLTGNFNADFLRSHTKGEAGAAIRNGSAARQARTEEETEGYETGERITTNADRIEYRNEENPGSAASPLGKRAEKRPPAPPSERDLAIEEAEEIAGGIVYSNLSELGDTNAGVGTRIILAALVDAGAPPERMGELADLGKRRLRRFQYRGGHVGNSAGYYTNLMRNLADEARREWWNAAKLEEKDRRNHERAIAASAARRQQQGYRYQ